MEIVANAVDYSYARPAPSLLKAAGYVIAARYVGNPNGDARVLSPEELHGLWMEGIRVVPIAQYGAVDRPRGGYNQGLWDGDRANFGLNLNKWPRHKPVILAVGDVGDPDGGGPKPPFPLESDYPIIKQYLKGFMDRCLWDAGVYGPYWLIERLANDPETAPWIVCYWQTAGQSGNGEGTGGSAFNPGDRTWRRLSIHADMYQQYGGEPVPGTDHNQVYEVDYDYFTYHPKDDEILEEDEEMPVTHIWTSSKNNREWLEELEYVLPPAVVADGGWDSVWAGLGCWETIDGQNTIRWLTQENLDLLKAVIWVQAVNGLKPTIVDEGFQETKWFRSKTVVPFDKNDPKGRLLPDELTGKA